MKRDWTLILTKVFFVLASLGTTVVINPWTAFDPINIPKMSILGLSVGFIVIFRTKYIIQSFRSWQNKLIKILLTSFIIGMTITLILVDSPIEQQFWGTWGRSTGYFSYISLVLLLVSVMALNQKLPLGYFLKLFRISSYITTSYVLIQLGDIDPIEWSQNLAIGTLGNINFVSAFLGMASSYFLSILIFDKVALVSKLYFFTLILLNSWIIWKSESLQGLLVMFVAGVAIGYWWLAQKKSVLMKLAWLFTSSFFGVLMLAGSAGRGPLGSLLLQETVLYRIDYWRAGLKMFLAHPFLGVGLDSYGDYYRQYRDQIAATRTGPQRITNTAHNVFLDLLSGSGILTGLSFVLIVIISIWSGGKLVRNHPSNLLAYHYLVILVGWFAFMMISINQIGVTVWGFVFLGCLHSELQSIFALPEKQNKFGSTPNSRIHLKTNRKFVFFPSFLLNFLRIGIGVCFSLICIFLPNKTDSEFLSSVRSKDFDSVIKISMMPSTLPFYREYAMQILIDENMEEEAANLARYTTGRDKRSFQAFVTIWLSRFTSTQEKEIAKMNLQLLDPHNMILRNSLTAP